MDHSSSPIDRIGQSVQHRWRLLMFIAGLIQHHLAKSGVDPGFMRKALIQA